MAHATVELALHGEQVGVITRDFTHEVGNLDHGNELLFALDPNYPKEGRYGVPEHTVDAVLQVLDPDAVRLLPGPWPTCVDCGADGLVGYLMLDAAICNTDRHHQNWGLLARSQGYVLAPTFDHASSLGRELRDEERERRLSTTDARGNLAAYVRRARSAFHGQGRLLSPIEAFLRAGEQRPRAKRAWLDRLRGLPADVFETVSDRVPGPQMSHPARKFALAMLRHTREQLEAIRA